jgi:hypothetical protein
MGRKPVLVPELSVLVPELSPVLVPELSLAVLLSARALFLSRVID